MPYRSGIGFLLKQYRLCQQALWDDELYVDTFGQLVTLFGENIRNHCDRKSLVADEYIFDHVNLTIKLEKPKEDAIPGSQDGIYKLTNEIFHKIAFEGRAGVFAAALEKRAARLEKSEVDEMSVHLASLRKELQQSKELLLRINKAL